jgi:hypothetical protein
MLRHRFPRTHRALQVTAYRAFGPFVRTAGDALLRLSPVDRSVYWERRQHMNYYRQVLELANTYVPSGSAVIDVGAGSTGVVGALSSFDRRVALDLHPIPNMDGVETIQADFLTYRPTVRFDLVLCLQVLEHLGEPESFARKLFESAHTVIISVPYRWPEGTCIWHVQDPVDEAKLLRWTRRQPTEVRIATDDHERLIAVYAPG